MPAVRPHQRQAAGVNHLGRADKIATLPQGRIFRCVGVDGGLHASTASGRLINSHRGAERLGDTRELKDKVASGLNTEAPAKGHAVGVQRIALHIAIGLPRPTAPKLCLPMNRGRFEHGQWHIVGHEETPHPNVGVGNPQRFEAPCRLHHMEPRASVVGVSRCSKTLQRCRGDEAVECFRSHQPREAIGREHSDGIEISIPTVAAWHAEFGDIFEWDAGRILVEQEKHATATPTERTKRDFPAIV